MDDVMRWMNIMCCTVLLSLTVYIIEGTLDRGCVVYCVFMRAVRCGLRTDYERSLKSLMRAASSQSTPLSTTASLYLAVTSNHMIPKSQLKLLF